MKGIINASSYHTKVSQVEIDKVVDKCSICRLISRKMNKKRVGLPKATTFNEVVSIDLKIHGNSTYVLWCVEKTTKLI